MSEALYPFALEPTERPLIWGGTALVSRYGKTAAPEARIGESWECYDGNAVRNGAFAGSTLGELRSRLGHAFTGAADPAATFPLLTKLIDARDALSVQVHPDDAYARRVERQPNGKTECWYVLEADAGAEIVLGWNRPTTRAEYLERVGTGTLDDVLRRVPARPGDVFHLPAGTLHAIGAGIVLFEVQQTSDLTYRIYDYNRPGPDGKPRELHVEKAADVLDYGQCFAGALRPLAYELDGLERTVLVADAHFIVERIVVPGHAGGIDLEGMPLVVQALGVALALEARDQSIRLEPYQSAVVPAALDVVMVRGDAGGTFLTAAPPHDADALDRRLGRAGVSLVATTDFFAQFGRRAGRAG